jgi:hypothetical protein
MLSVYKNITYFTDEGDNILAGIALNNGIKIYDGFYSQHLPGMYFIMAIIAKLGFHTVEQFRIGSYILLAIIWTFMYIRYSKHFDKKILFLYPIFYIGMMSIGEFTSATIVAEQFQSQFLMILLLEFIMFYRNKKFSKYSELIIGLSIFMSVMIAFVSVIPICIFVIGLFCIDIINYCQKEKFNIIKYIQHFFKNYYKVLLFTILPFILFLIYLIVTKTLIGCYEQAFYLNTNIYSKYSGYSSNPLITLIKMIPTYFTTIKNFIFNIITKNSFIDNFILLVLNLTFILYLFKNFSKEKLLSIFMILFSLGCANRGFVGFHGLPFLASISLISLLNIELFSEVKNFKYILSLMILIILLNYIPYISNIFQPLNESDKNYEMFDKLLDEDDTIYLINLDTPGYINSGRLPSSRMYSLVPWFSEVYEDEVIEDVENNKPKLIAYSPNIDIWGYIIKDYASKLNEYILQNYTYVSLINYWVINDYVDDVEEKLNINIADETTDYGNLILSNPLVDNTYMEQYFKFEQSNLDSIDLKFATYARENYSLVTFELYEDDKIIWNKTISADTLGDYSFYKLEFNDLKVDTNKTYKLKITTSYTTNFDYVSIYFSDYTTSLNDYLYINGEKTNYNLDMNLYYE